MDQVLRILVGFALAVIPSVLLCRVVMSLGVVDAPTEARKTQAAPVPTLGGVAIALSTLLAISVDNELIAGEFNPMLFIVGEGRSSPCWSAWRMTCSAFVRRSNCCC